MITGDKLIILESFKIDENLPKFTSNKKSGILISNNSNEGWSFGGSGQSSVINDGVIEEFTKLSVDYLVYLREQINRFDISIFQKIKFNIILLIVTKFFKKDKKKNVINKRQYDSISEFFQTIKGNKMEISQTKDIMERYEIVLKEAQKNHQQALVDKILKMKDVISGETRLIENGITKYVSEDQVVKLYKQTNKDKKLQLTYIENYIRVIPSEVIVLKEKADELKVFDNYVILHYDPIGIATELTEKEKVKAKDPIMFGVIQNSRKLYFIGDWVDDYCDLTLDKMMERIQDKEHILTNDSVKSYINSSL